MRNRVLSWSDRIVLPLILLVVTTLAVCSVGAVVLNIVVPPPYAVYSYRLQAEVACPLDPALGIIETEVREGYDIKSIEYTSTWINTSGGADYPGGILTDYSPPKPHGRKPAVSPRVRQVPPTTGTWKLRTDAEVVYTRWRIPFVHDHVIFTSENSVKVLNADAPMCRKVSG